MRTGLLLTALLALVACSPSDEAPDGEETGTAAPAPLVTTETLPAVRQVIPGAAVHAPGPGETLERLPTPVVAPPPPRPVNLGIVVVEEATRLRTRRGMVTLAGTQGVAPEALCRLEDGRTPTCEVLARTAVRRYVGRRSVSCTLTLREDTRDDHRTSCLVAGSDLALWVVEQGWAFADASAPSDLRDAEALARREQRGLWASLGER